MKLLHGTLADRGYHKLQPQKSVVGRKRTAYVWEVIAVPDADHREFLGRLFRLTDLQRGKWPRGFRFRNIHTGEVLQP